MNKNEIINKTNELLTKIIITNFFDRLENPYIRFQNNDKFITIMGNENMTLYNSLLKEIHCLNKSVFETYSFKTLQSDFDEILISLYKLKKLFKLEDLENIINNIIKKEIDYFIVIRPIFGLKLQKKYYPIELGPFIIYSFEENKDKIEKVTEINLDKLLMDNFKSEYIIIYKAKAREKNKAEEIADEAFYLFENFLRFALDFKNENSDIGILNFNFDYFIQRIIISKKLVFTPLSRKGIFIPIEIDYSNNILLDNNNGNNKIWELLYNKNLNEIKKRLISAITWIGKASKDLDLKNKFLQYFIALECLFVYQEKTIITPSIISQISENIALLLGSGSGFDNIITIENDIKKLYELRSSIVHGGSKIITENEVYKINYLSLLAVRKFLTTDELFNMNKIENLIIYFKKLKYK